MQIHYRDPWMNALNERQKMFQEQVARLVPILQRFGFEMETDRLYKLLESGSGKFTAFFRSSSRILKISFLTGRHNDGAVSFSIYPTTESKGINLYKYLRQHFSLVNRRSLFLSKYKGNLSERLSKVFDMYLRYGEFYMYGILAGLKWDEE
ncbi:MAG: hypothetical protein OEQ53_18825 [Saprospiraceae bacterium]|nr:hypothetical protein [Saprospiraceae bacterium]